jgi:hypothetical protein
MRNIIQYQKINHHVLTFCQNHISCDSHNFLLINKKLMLLYFLESSQSELPNERKLIRTIERSPVHNSNRLTPSSCDCHNFHSMDEFIHFLESLWRVLQLL